MRMKQETKLKDSDVEACERILRPTLPGWHFFWNNSTAKKGYSGVAILSRCDHRIPNFCQMSTQRNRSVAGMGCSLVILWLLLHDAVAALSPPHSTPLKCLQDRAAGSQQRPGCGGARPGGAPHHCRVPLLLRCCTTCLASRLQGSCMHGPKPSAPCLVSPMVGAQVCVHQELIAWTGGRSSHVQCLGAVVNTYVPNSGDGLKRLEYRLRSWDVALAAYLERLGAEKPVILTGDLNCAHQEIDIHAPKRNLKSAGFTPARMPSLLLNILHHGSG